MRMVVVYYEYFKAWSYIDICGIVYVINPLYLQDVSAVKYTLNAEIIQDPSCAAPLALA